MEERVSKLERQVARLLKGKRPRDDGREVFANLEDRHLRAWRNAGNSGNADDHLDPSRHIERAFRITQDEFEDLAEYLADREGAVFTATAEEIVITVDRGTIRATLK